MTDTTSTSSETTTTAGVQQEAVLPPAGGREQGTVGDDDDGRQEAARSPQAPGEQVDADALRREAATRRRQLRSVERERDDIAADRDRLMARLDRQDRAEVERIAAERLHDPGDVWRDGIELSELRDDEGDIDAERVRAALDRVAERHPHWLRPSPGRVPIWPAGAQPPDPGPASFGERLKEAVQGGE